MSPKPTSEGTKAPVPTPAKAIKGKEQEQQGKQSQPSPAKKEKAPAAPLKEFTADQKKLIRNVALWNASQYNGKANPGSVLGKVIAQDPALKSDMRSLAMTIQVIIKEIEKLSPEQQHAEVEKNAPELLEKKKEEKKELPELPNAVMGKVVTRMPPEPSKYPHLGHAFAFSSSYLFAKKYNGKCILRFEDTNPAMSTQEYVDATKEDIKWLGLSWDEEFYISDHMKEILAVGDKLIADGHMYVCKCPQETMKELRNAGKPCEHRTQAKKETEKLWKEMLAGKFNDGEACLRLRADLTNNNGVLRDPVLFRVDTHTHYRHGTKYKVWPLYDMASVISEQMNGVTHVMRSAEFMLRGELHDKLRSLLEYRPLTMFEYGRVNIIGSTTKGREIREIVQKSGVGWDDPRLVTIRALRRRGILPQTFRELIFDLGFKRDQANVDFAMLASHQRKNIDGTTPRAFFVKDPVKISLTGAPAQQVKLPRHPDHPEFGVRPYNTTSEFFMTKEDFDGMQDGQLYRFMECANFEKKGKKFTFVSQSVDEYRKRGKAIFHWLPQDPKQTHKAKVLMPDAAWVEGVVGKDVEMLKVGDLVQFERFGFCRLDRVHDGVYEFWYTHK